MSHPTIPFLKNKADKTSLAEKLASTVPPIHSMDSRFKQNSIIKTPNPVDITKKWASPNIVTTIIKEFKAANPKIISQPSNTDLLIWLYNRALEAEGQLKLMEQDANIIKSGENGV